ncbi:MAG: thioredoxin family protein [Crenarchaeota archaeon]|nr:thioredoxin family protein [Thermoproteota archaeon]MDW8033476.1 thioredoxin family protein [Nitrososphaerota archaeon]
MSLLDDESKKRVKEILSRDFRNPVDIMVFTEEEGCRFCKETLQIAREVSSLNPDIMVKHYPYGSSSWEAEKYGIKIFPATIIASPEKDYGIRFFGIPSGYEFETYLKDILMVSNGKTMLRDSTKDFIKSIREPLNIKVFVTPTCPYCPSMVFYAHQFAFENDMIIGEMIEAMEFPKLAEKYNVTGVPKLVVNDLHELIGMRSEKQLVDFLKHVLED